MAPGLDRERAREAVDRSLGGRVAGVAGIADNRPGHRRDADHPAPAALDHAGEHGPGDVERGLQVDGDVAVPLLLGDLDERHQRAVLAQLGDTGVVDQDVHRAQPHRHLGRQLPSLAVVGQVGDKPGRLDALGRQLRRPLMDAFGGRRDGHPGPTPAEQRRRGEADPLRRASARDQRHAPGVAIPVSHRSARPRPRRTPRCGGRRPRPSSPGTSAPCCGTA